MMDKNQEYVWGESIRWIPGWEGMYAVTIDGCVASYTCNNRNSGKHVWMKAQTNQEGYRYVTLGANRESPGKDKRIHKLVWETFIGPVPPGVDVHHKYNNKEDNQLWNLEALVKGKHASLHRRKRIDKLTPEQAKEIKYRALAGEQVRSLAREFGVSECFVSQIKHGNKWSRIKIDTSQFKAPKSRKSSQFRGVCRNSTYKKWLVQTQVNGKRKFIGHFDDEVEAAKAYDNAARKYHGPKAKLNFPDEPK
jgi:hypothetical protein